MTFGKAAIFAALAAISFTGNYLVSASLVTAKANETVSAYIPGGSHMNEWCDTSKFDRIDWIASWALRDLDLSAEQQAKFDKVMQVSKQSIAGAQTLCSIDRTALHALPAPEQLGKLRAMLAEAGQVIDEISAPFADFHASLSEEQAEKFRQLMNHEGRKGRWHRRG